MNARDTSGSLAILLGRLSDVFLITAAAGKSLLAGFHGEALQFELNGNQLSLRDWFVFLGYAGLYGVLALYALVSDRKVTIAGIFMVAVLGSSLAAMLTRGGSVFPYNMDAPRYLLAYKLSAAAFVWVLADALMALVGPLSSLSSKRRYRGLLVASVLVFFGALLILQKEAFDTVVSREVEFLDEQAAHELAIYGLGSDATNSYDLRGWVTGASGSKVYKPVIDWLSHNNANVFSPKFRGSKQFEEYLAARALFNSARQTVNAMGVNANKCFTHEGFDVATAWELSFSSELNERFWLEFSGSNEPSLIYWARQGTQLLYGTFPAALPVQFCMPKAVAVESFSVTH